MNRSHAKIRALVEQAVATLKSWRLLRKLRCSTTQITSLVQAVLTLHLTSCQRQSMCFAGVTGCNALEERGSCEQCYSPRQEEGLLHDRVTAGFMQPELRVGS